MRAFQISALIETAVKDERERGIIRSKALEDAARQALEALELEATSPPIDTTAAAMDALRAALAEPVSKAQA